MANYPRLESSPWHRLSTQLPQILMRLKENQTRQQNIETQRQDQLRQQAQQQANADRQFNLTEKHAETARQDKKSEELWTLYRELPDDQLENFVKANPIWARQSGVYESGIASTMEYEEGLDAYERYLSDELGYDEALFQAGDSNFANMIASVRQSNLDADLTRNRISNEQNQLYGFNKYEAERLTTENSNIDTMLMNPQMHAAQAGITSKKGVEKFTKDLIARKQANRTEFRNLWGGKTAPKDSLNILGDKLPDLSNILDTSKKKNTANAILVSKLPLANKPQKEQYKIVRVALKNPNLTDREIARLISASGGIKMGNLFKGIREYEWQGGNVGGFTPSPTRQTGIQKLIQ